MKSFGTLEYAIDKYSGTWAWKVTGSRAVMMASKIISQLWYGDGPNEAIIPDNANNVKQIKWILDRYPMEVLSKDFKSEICDICDLLQLRHGDEIASDVLKAFFAENSD